MQPCHHGLRRHLQRCYASEGTFNFIYLTVGVTSRAVMGVRQQSPVSACAEAAEQNTKLSRQQGLELVPVDVSGAVRVGLCQQVVQIDGELEVEYHLPQPRYVCPPAAVRQAPEGAEGANQVCAAGAV